MISDKLRNDMLAKGIDIELSLSILEGLNSGSQAPAPALKASGVPKVDGVSVLSLSGNLRYALPYELAKERLAALGLELPAGLARQEENRPASAARSLTT
jgi:hypothetical protein